LAANAVVRARIDERVKEVAAVVLAAMGLTLSGAFRILLTRVAREKALPFEPLVPNAEAIASMKDARRGKLCVLRQRGSIDGRLECGRLSGPVSSNATTSGSNKVRTGGRRKAISSTHGEPPSGVGHPK